MLAIRALNPPPGRLPQAGVIVEVIQQRELVGRQRVLLLQTGSAQVPHLATSGLLPGALADHLASFGGDSWRRRGQTMAGDWIQTGGTAPYGIVSEPCNHLQKIHTRSCFGRTTCTERR